MKGLIKYFKGKTGTKNGAAAIYVVIFTTVTKHLSQYPATPTGKGSNEV